jgi:WD40 repeat protein
VLNHLIGNGRVRSVAWRPDGKNIASGSDDKTIKVWNAQTGQCASTSVDSGAFGVKSISYSPAGDMIAAGCSNGKIHLLDTATFAVRRSLNGHSSDVRAVSWRPDGTMLASCSDDKTIKLWDTQSGKVNSTLSRHEDPVRSVCFSPCGTKIASGGGLPQPNPQRNWGNGDFSIRIWDVETGTQIGSPLSGHSDR